MAGLLQTGTLIDGQWMTTSVDINTVLERNRERKEEELQSEPEKAPFFGLLTQTVIDSPAIRWIFPARIRSAEHPDIAFIGDYSVYIRRLRNDGQLRDVAQKTDFGSRIRNAGVVDLCAVDRIITEDSIVSPKIMRENGDLPMPDASFSTSKIIPPQIIVLVLESGDLVFLFASHAGRTVDFITCRHRIADKMLLKQGQPGSHLAIDPSSRYLAIAGLEEDPIAVFSLHSKEKLAAQHAQGGSLRPISSERYVYVKGVVLHMQFLFPSAGDPNHVILLILAVKNGSTAMFVFEWEAGRSLSEIRSNNSRGHILASRYRMPLLLIPLTIKSAFLLVSTGLIAECTNLLEGSPKFLDVPVQINRVSQVHLGLSAPLWTSWTRPARTRGYAQSHDDIYIAREDGFVAFLEISDEESQSYIQGQMEAGRFDCKIGSAFASIGVAGNDILAAAGDSCHGGVYLVAARKQPVFLEPIPNWSPTIDFVTSARVQDQPHLSHKQHEQPKRRRLAVDEPDRIFTCTGRGPHGAVSEIRYGYEARLLIDVSQLDFPIRETWVLPIEFSRSGGVNSVASSPTLFLLSLGNESILLQLTPASSEAEEGIEEINQSLTWLDLSSRTIAAATFNDLVVQITETSFTISAVPPLDQNTNPLAIRRTDLPTGTRAVAAAVYQNILAVFVVRDEDGTMHLRGASLSLDDIEKDLMIDKAPREVPPMKPFNHDHTLTEYPNSVSILRRSDDAIYVTVCSARGTVASSVSSHPAVFRLEYFENGQELVRVEPTTEYWPLNELTDQFDAIPAACVDIINIKGLESDLGQPELLLAGYTSGLLVIKRYSAIFDGRADETKSLRYNLGSAPVTFAVDPALLNVVLICCDAKLWRLEYNSLSKADPVLHRVWFTEIANTLHIQPKIDHVSVMPQGLLLTCGKGLFITSIDPQPKPIPRLMPIKGAPSRLLYSHRLGKLIVAMASERRSTFDIMEPETGASQGQYFTSGGHRSEFPVGLGNLDEKILCLVEWQLEAPEKNLHLVLCGTSSGGLLIYKIEQDDCDLMPDDDGVRCTAFLGEYHDAPVSAITTSASTFFYSVGRTVRWVSLDTTQEALLIRAEYKLPSHASSISVMGHWLSVLTAKHSLITLLVVDKRKHPQLADHHGQLYPQFADEPPRDGLHQIRLPSDFLEQHVKESGMIMVADKDCSVIGLWSSEKAHPLAADYEMVFEAELRSSILKFRFGRIRPPWDKIWKRQKDVQSPREVGELLGIGIDGSITHFTVLTEQVWRLLKFLQDMALRSMEIRPMALSSGHLGHKQDPRTKHIDGETLRPFLDHRRLETLLITDGERAEPGRKDDIIEEFCSLVNGLPCLKPIQEADKTLDDCLKEAYQFLAELLRPVF